MSNARRNQNPAANQQFNQAPILATPPDAPRAQRPPRRRSGGGGGGKPRHYRNDNVSLLPPLQAASSSDGPPRPTHLSTTSTPERNDPLWTKGLAGAELQPIPRTEYLYSGAEALPQLVTVLHASCTAGSSGYARKVPESATSYYCGVLVYARMLQLACDNGHRVTYNEERFVEQISSLSLKPPMLLAHYLAGFGNTRVPSGRDLKFALRDRPYVATPLVGGFWGSVSPQTQPLYQNYPSLGVYASRVQADLSKAEYARHWSLPDEIAAVPAGGEGPSLAMLGYGYRARISAVQRAFLESAEIFHGEMFPSANEDIPLCSNLLVAVQLELNNIQRMRLSNMPTLLAGSQAQLCTVSYDDELIPIAEKPMTLACRFHLPAEISFPASAFCYRTVHSVELVDEDHVMPWCVWRYPHHYARPWMATALEGNALRDLEPVMIKCLEFHTTPYLVKARLEALERAFTDAELISTRPRTCGASSTKHVENHTG